MQGQFWLSLLVALLLFLSSSPVAHASLLYTADTSGAVLVQSRRTLRDQDRHSWQVIAFKHIQPNRPEGKLTLRLVGFPDGMGIAHPQPLTLVPLQGQPHLVADLTAQIAPESPHSPESPSTIGQVNLGQVGQYDLQSVWMQLPLEPLQLEIFTDTVPISLRISPAMLEEWQQVSGVSYDDVLKSCQKFPIEARQNPAFPAWVGCKTP